jgi:cytochrome c5
MVVARLRSTPILTATRCRRLDCPQCPSEIHRSQAALPSHNRRTTLATRRAAVFDGPVVGSPDEVITMATFSTQILSRQLRLWTNTAVRGHCCAALAVSALLLAGCGVELQNRQPAEELAKAAQPPGSIYTGWRVFQDKCAKCHGPSATGSAQGPDLLPRVAEMGPRRLVGLVLRRYDWNLSASEAGAGSAAREALIDDVLQRKDDALKMPAWQGEPRVNAHIVDLYAYLSARSQGTQGLGRPAP